MLQVARQKVMPLQMSHFAEAEFPIRFVKGFESRSNKFGDGWFLFQN